MVTPVKRWEITTEQLRLVGAMVGMLGHPATTERSVYNDVVFHQRKWPVGELQVVLEIRWYDSSGLVISVGLHLLDSMGMCLEDEVFRVV